MEIRKSVLIFFVQEPTKCITKLLLHVHVDSVSAKEVVPWHSPIL